MVIEVQDLVVDYQDFRAVNGISFSVAEGEIFGIVGPNGAGKTTTIECLEGIRTRYSGTISVLGLNPITQRQQLSQQVGVQLQETSYQDRIRVWELCRMFSAMYSEPVSYPNLLARFGLENKWRNYVSTLSGGERQKLAIVLALIPSPKVLFLDELSTGLDPHARRAMWGLIKDLRDEGRTICMTTHFMDEAEHLCDRIAIINNGQFVAVDSVQGLFRHFGMVSIVEFSAVNAESSNLHSLTGVTRVERMGETVRVYGTGPSLVNDIVEHLMTRQIAYSNLNIKRPSLEDVFLTATGGAMEGYGE